MDEQLGAILDDADLHRGLGLNDTPLMESNTAEEPPQMDAPNSGENLVSLSSLPAVDDKLGHLCIVLSPQVRRQLMRGEPLIVGTSTASVEAFFHRLISVCQMGAHMPVMFQTLGGAVTVANIKKRKHGIISKPAADRYPIPRMGTIVPPTKKAKTSRSAETDSLIPTNSAPERVLEVPEIANAGVEQESDNAAGNKTFSEKNEIPLEAIRLYLKQKCYYPGWNPNAKRNLRKRCKDFELDSDGTLLYKTKNDYHLICVEDRAQRMNLIWESHVVDHKRRDGLLAVLKEKYYWKGMFQDVNKVLDSCEVCAGHRDGKARREAFVEEAKQAEDDVVNVDSDPTYSVEKFPETSEVQLLGQFLPDGFQ
ncbi:uncharacterized protein LOC129585654 [Paramacrobiotus metropolitanus]|uniref:uncharacterized protein LOC129585654 n=1 Tax=Paramacrobiotus metropolitanus TaxID=2943436 RepID=UPI002445F60B|nr:uncharacterized protein LOC129585654 [Paramacrobiotus metropolitanus]XP_055334396.1 uncharacterized protein LOC129585654 [Paramacrobiotus metropolitanus]